MQLIDSIKLLFKFQFFPYKNVFMEIQKTILSNSMWNQWEGKTIVNVIVGK